MNDFITKYQNELTGTLSGFDRLVFRGTLWRNRLSGMKGYLWAHGLGSKDFGEHAEQVSRRVKEATDAGCWSTRALSEFWQGQQATDSPGDRRGRQSQRRSRLCPDGSGVVQQLWHPARRRDREAGFEKSEP